MQADRAASSVSSRKPAWPQLNHPNIVTIYALKPADATVYLGMEYLPRAAACVCQAALRINPDDAEAHDNLGVVYGQQGRTDEAIREYQAALRINPDLCRSALQPGRDYGQQGARLRRSGSTRRRCGSTPTMPKRTTTWA